MAFAWTEDLIHGAAHERELHSSGLAREITKFP